MRLLPSSLALAELRGDATTTEALHVLLSADDAKRFVRHTPVTAEAAWASLSEDDQDRLYVGFVNGQWRRDHVFPLVKGVPNRVGRLRGYGNALCAPLAQAVIETFLDAEAAGFDSRDVDDDAGLLP